MLNIPALLLLLQQYLQNNNNRRELEKARGVVWYTRDEYSVSKWLLLQKPSKSVCTYALTSVNVHLGQCYDTIVMNIYAVLYSLKSTHTFIIVFDIHHLSRRSDA